MKWLNNDHKIARVVSDEHVKISKSEGVRLVKKYRYTNSHACYIFAFRVNYFTEMC